MGNGKSKRIAMMSHAHNWSLTLEWQKIDDSDALCPTAFCTKRGCKEKLNWKEIEQRLNESERMKKERSDDQAQPQSQA
jgi:hypothetical protein